jgi:hypothetical protein
MFLITLPGDSKTRMNASVLLGAFLVLCRQWSADQVFEVLGSEEGNFKFVCSWASSPLAATMPIKFCWEGLEIAQQHGWIDANGMLEDDLLTDLWCSMYRRMVTTYDASWIVPGKLMVSSDPVTTVNDPNPQTFTELWPSETRCASYNDLVALDRVETEDTPPDAWCRSISYSLTGVDAVDPDEPLSQSCSTVDLPFFSLHGTRQDTDNTAAQCVKKYPNAEDRESSVETVCKDYGALCADMKTVSAKAQQSTTESFAGFLQSCGVSLVIRTNYSDERGMPAPSYDGDKLLELGIRHEDIQFADKNGGLPDRSCVASLLQACPADEDELEGAVLIHCKGGFGRSVMLACCHLIHTYNVPGRALLGWVRIARPGAITTPQQEEFLISMNGREDVLRFAGLQRRFSRRYQDFARLWTPSNASKSHSPSLWTETPLSPGLWKKKNGKQVKSPSSLSTSRREGKAEENYAQTPEGSPRIPSGGKAKDARRSLWIMAASMIPKSSRGHKKMHEELVKSRLTWDTTESCSIDVATVISI